jgi:hypothetical protein
MVVSCSFIQGRAAGAVHCCWHRGWMTPNGAGVDGRCPLQRSAPSVADASTDGSDCQLPPQESRCVWGPLERITVYARLRVSLSRLFFVVSFFQTSEWGTDGEQEPRFHGRSLTTIGNFGGYYYTFFFAGKAIIILAHCFSTVRLCLNRSVVSQTGRVEPLRFQPQNIHFD